MGFQSTQDFHSGLYVWQFDSLDVFSKGGFRYSLLIAIFILNLHSGYDHYWEIRCQSDSSSAFAPVLLAYSDGGLVSVDLETSPVIYHYSRRLV